MDSTSGFVVYGGLPKQGSSSCGCCTHTSPSLTAFMVITSQFLAIRNTLSYKVASFRLSMVVFSSVLLEIGSLQ